MPDEHAARVERVQEEAAAAAAPGGAVVDAGWPEEPYCQGLRGCNKARPAWFGRGEI